MLFLGAILEMAAILKSYAMGPYPILFSRSKCTILEVLTLLSLNPRFCQKSAPLQHFIRRFKGIDTRSFGVSMVLLIGKSHVFAVMAFIGLKGLKPMYMNRNMEKKCENVCKHL